MFWNDRGTKRAEKRQVSRKVLHSYFHERDRDPSKILATSRSRVPFGVNGIDYIASTLIRLMIGKDGSKDGSKNGMTSALKGCIDG